MFQKAEGGRDPSGVSIDEYSKTQGDIPIFFTGKARLLSQEEESLISYLEGMGIPGLTSIRQTISEKEEVLRGLEKNYTGEGEALQRLDSVIDYLGRIIVEEPEMNITELQELIKNVLSKKSDLSQMYDKKVRVEFSKKIQELARDCRMGDLHAKQIQPRKISIIDRLRGKKRYYDARNQYLQLLIQKEKNEEIHAEDVAIEETLKKYVNDNLTDEAKKTILHYLRIMGIRRIDKNIEDKLRVTNQEASLSFRETSLQLPGKFSYRKASKKFKEESANLEEELAATKEDRTFRESIAVDTNSPEYEFEKAVLELFKHLNDENTPTRETQLEEHN